MELLHDGLNWEELTEEQNEALLVQCYQAGCVWAGPKLPITSILPCGKKLIVRGFKSDYNDAFIRGWKSAKTLQGIK